MKRKAVRRTVRKVKRDKKPPDPMLAAMVEEMQASHQELAGRILARAQAIETQMKFHITRRDKTKKFEDLEGKTFGQLLTVFKQHCTDQTLNEWLNTMRETRNDVAHTYFRDLAWMQHQFGPGTVRLNHKALRKGLRVSEFCLGLLTKLLKQRLPKQSVEAPLSHTQAMPAP